VASRSSSKPRIVAITNVAVRVAFGLITERNEGHYYS
jgi:hypothetical protein